MNGINKLKEILNNAPEGATHVEIFTQIKQVPYFYRREFKAWCNKFVYDWWDKDNQQWLNTTTPTGDMRSLADITELVELRKKNAELEKMLIKLVDDEQNEWYRLEILNLLNGVDNL